MRVRKNAALLTADEWKRYCRAVVTLKHTPVAGSDISIYDLFVALHLCVDALVDSETETINRPDAAHRDSGFLPWHREYLLRYEEELVKVDPRVSLPYWNWGLGEADETDGLFEDDRMGQRNGVISSGYFSPDGHTDFQLGWEIHENLRRFGISKALHRGTTAWPAGDLPSADDVLRVLAYTDYGTFLNGIGVEIGLERLHGTVHGLVGGHMSNFSSPNDPLFFMHHAQVDRIWAMWQREHPGADDYPTNGALGHALNDNMWPWDGGASTPSDSTLEALIPRLEASDLVKPANVLDTRELGYIYDGEDARWDIGKTGESVDHNWSTVHLNSRYGRNLVVVACLGTFAGSDTASVRIRSRAGDQHVDLMVEEEQSRDAEIVHAKESVGYLVGEEGLIYDESNRIVVGEMGSISFRQMTRDLWKTVVFKHSYSNPVIIATISTYFGDHAAHVRIREVTGYSFSMCIEEWKYLDDYHTTEDVSYLVVEEGDHLLPDGARMLAGRTTATHEWKTVAFNPSFADEPVVLSQCMTVNGSDPVVTRQSNVLNSSFNVRLQEEETLGGGIHIEETVGYIACG